MLKNFFQRKLLGLVVHNGKKNDTKGVLHLRVLIQLIDNHLRKLVFFQPYCNPHPLPVRLIPDVSYSFELLSLCQVRNFFNKSCLFLLELWCKYKLLMRLKELKQ